MNRKQLLEKELSEINYMRIEEELRVENAITTLRQDENFRLIDDERRKLKLELGKLDEGSAEIENIHKQLIKLDKKCNDFIVKKGIDPKILEHNYTCPKCQDTGRIDNALCDCLKTRLQKALITQSGINGKLNYDFSKSNPQILEENPLLSKAYKVAHTYCENFPNNQRNNMIFYGEVGTGKTFLLECIANDLMQKLNYVVFTTAYDINKTMIRAFNSPYSERDTLLSPLFESDLLIIDDLGTEPIFHESTITNLFTLINERQRNNLPIIYSTNLSPEQINERYGDRIKSRIYNMQITVPVLFESSDLRLKQK